MSSDRLLLEISLSSTFANPLRKVSDRLYQIQAIRQFYGINRLEVFGTVINKMEEQEQDLSRLLEPNSPQFKFEKLISELEQGINNHSKDERLDHRSTDDSDGKTAAKDGFQAEPNHLKISVLPYIQIDAPTEKSQTGTVRTGLVRKLITHLKAAPLRKEMKKLLNSFLRNKDKSKGEKLTDIRELPKKNILCQQKRKALATNKQSNRSVPPEPKHRSAANLRHLVKFVLNGELDTEMYPPFVLSQGVQAGFREVFEFIANDSNRPVLLEKLKLTRMDRTISKRSLTYRDHLKDHPPIVRVKILNEFIRELRRELREY